MKYSFLHLLFSFASLYSFASGGIREVNAILGDQSFEIKFGRVPLETTNEILRIQTHLAYVEELLQSKEVLTLNLQQRSNRNKIVALLHQYRMIGVFPSNYDYANERRPCFIDKNGNICAVGYLIEKTKGRAMAEQINSRHRYEFLLEMNEPAINEWAHEFGLTMEESAMIQPSYGPPPAPINRSVEIETSYGITSGVIGGINLATTIANFSYPASHSPTIGYIGLLTGATQIIMGAANIKQPQTTYYFNGGELTESYKAQNNLSYVNIAMGTTVVISSTIRLLMNKKNKDARNAYNIYTYPNSNNALTMGISLRRRI